MDNEIDRKIDVTAILFLLVQNRQQTHDWTLDQEGDGAICSLVEYTASIPLQQIICFKKIQLCLKSQGWDIKRTKNIYIPIYLEW